MTTTGPLATEPDMTHVDGDAVIGALSIALGVDIGRAGAVCDTVPVEIAHRIQVTMNGVAALDLTSNR